ncbi:DUF2255 family protein [Actinacidiphila sp. ITFR-21]|uniref:DUF2255 family protein n=1 Tax=Actinacidiphila sp. ITFR-21 TaxID=3075199 RepID=UPI002889BB6B|nr:DUF2255 family protein [Streptomyces sp. ITFR-21]WNI18860.1 DUF2255 family protein [Streptomyces sp. ITFR-21]
MTAWTNDELSRIEHADELEIAPLGGDGTPGRPVPIWVVRDGDHLYVRSYRGEGGAWFRAARASRAGRIRAGGVAKDVALVEENDPALGDRLDAAYRTKYSRYDATYVDPMVAEGARHATLRLLPR